MSFVRALPPRGALLSLALVGLLGAGALPARAEDPAPPAPPAAPAEEVKIPWVKNWNDALAQAKRDKKDLLIDFTGSDWCGWCKRLEGEVFEHAEFLEKATKDFVFVFLDFPRGEALKKEVVDPELNQKLNKAYGVEGFPTIILANADGLPYARTGYQEGGPEGYLTHLAELRTAGEKIKGLIARGKTDAAAFKAGFEALAQTGFLGYPDYAWAIDQAEKQDKDGSQGLKPLVEKERSRQRGAVEQAAIDKLLEGVKSRDDVPWAKLHEALLATKDMGGMPLLQLSDAVAGWLTSQGRHADAKAMYQLPLRDPEIAGNPRFKQALEERIAQCDQALAPPKPEEPKPDEPKPDEPKPEEPKPEQPK